MPDGNNYQVQSEKTFNKICSSLEESGINEPERLTMFEFRTKIEYFSEKFDKLKKK